MWLWIPFTIFAAFMQSWRNAFQKQLSQDVNTTGVTLARFIYAGPLAALYVLALYAWQPVAMPHLSGLFWVYVVLASVAQIFATSLMVMLFRLRNYAIGVGLAKSEAVMAAILGALFFGAPLSALAWMGVFIGGLAIWLMSNPGSFRDISLSTVVTGLGSGLCFALTVLWVREASLLLELPFPYSAAWVLVAVITTQTIILISWLLLRDKQTLVALWKRPKLTLTISLFSCLGSLGWFTAMSLQTAAMVKTLGQIEVLFTLMISVIWFREKLKPKDKIGLALIVIGAIFVMLA